MNTRQPGTLAPQDAARLTDFARAFKAAARAVVLYPGGHPAIAATLGRIVQLTSPATMPRPMRITVLPDGLLLDDEAPARVDAAIVELASLLHTHLIGQMVVHAGGDVDAWRTFLLLLGRSPETVRGEGGIARVWTTMAGRHVELREIDYGEVLRERSGGESAAWDKVIQNCLQGTSFDLDEQAISELLGIAADADKLSELMSVVEAKAGAEGGVGAKAAALMRMLRGIVDAVSKGDPERLEPVLRNMASAVGQLSPEVLMGLMTDRDTDDDGPRLMNAVVSRMSDGTIAKFIARNVVAESSPTDRLAQAFQTLVREGEERQRLLALAREDVAASPLGSTEGFEAVWDQVAQKLLTSYSDKPFVSEDYGRELSGARAKAMEIEQVNDDPPERVGVWLSTVATSALRALDLTLFLDLLRIEDDDAKWGELMVPMVRLLEDLLLVGDFEAAIALLDVLVREASGSGSTARRQHATTAIDLLIAGPMMRHITTHLSTIDDTQFGRVKTMCVSLGEVLVRPLAETLATEERPRPRERLTAILLAFGAVGRRTVERLKNSPNAAVRRTAIHLLREFGGSEALPELASMLGDSDPQVQREAIRAIVQIATTAAYEVLQRALVAGGASRETVLRELLELHDDRAIPLLCYVLDHTRPRGKLAQVHAEIIDALGGLSAHQDSTRTLRRVLYEGDWWAPLRTAGLRKAAAVALRRLGSREAAAILQEAATQGSRGVRNAARAEAAAAVRRERERA
jgi:hypothetical protein